MLAGQPAACSILDEVNSIIVGLIVIGKSKLHPVQRKECCQTRLADHLCTTGWHQPPTQCGWFLSRKLRLRQLKIGWGGDCFCLLDGGPHWDWATTGAQRSCCCCCAGAQCTWYVLPAVFLCITCEGYKSATGYSKMWGVMFWCLNNRIEAETGEENDDGEADMGGYGRLQGLIVNDYSLNTNSQIGCHIQWYA